MKRIFRNIGWLLGSRGVNAAFSLVYLALATRMLGLEGFGRFALLIVLAQGVAGLASFNTWQAVVRWGSEEGHAATAAGFALALDLTSVAFGSFLALAAAWTAPYWLPLPPELRPLIFAMCMACLLAIRSTPTGVLRLHDRYDLATLAEAALPATRAVGAAIAAVAAPSIAGFVAAWAVAELVCAVAHWLLARKFVPLKLSDISLKRLPAGRQRVWQFIFATNFSRSLAVTGKQVLMLLVGAFGGAALAGGYRVAVQFGQALVQLGEAAARALYPELIRTSQAAHDLAGRMAVLALGAGSIAVVAAILGGRWAIAAIAGPEFVFAYTTLVLLAVAGAVELLGASWEALLVSKGRAELAFALRAGPLALAMCLLPAAIEAWGLPGVGACILLASSATVAGFAYAASRLPRATELPRGTIR